MISAGLLQWLSGGWMVLAAITCFTLLRVVAPYGRHRRAGWGPELPGWLGWMVMEAPAPVLVTALAVVGGRLHRPGVAVLASLWLLHYLHRTVVYPLRRRHGSPIPASVVAMDFAFNVANGALQGAWIGIFGPQYGAGWLHAPRFVTGAALFVAGFIVNIHSDEILRRLRRRTRGAYGVPREGLFRWVSCPNYLGEMVEWSGWALATWSLPGLAFAAWTAANLVPRALAHHRWYRRRFASYPAERRALLPGLL